jgi:hypothetical protein
MRTVVTPDYRQTQGNEGAYALHRVEEDAAHSFDDHFLEVRGRDPCLGWRRHQQGEILRRRQGSPDRARAVLRPLQDV